MKRLSKIALWLGAVALVAMTTNGACGGGGGPAGPAYQVTDLGPGSCRWLNDSGQVIGSDAEQHGFLVAPDGSRTALGKLAGDTITVPLAINAAGVIAGYGEGPKGRHAAIWRNGAWSAVPTSSKWSIASSINDDGAVVGVASTSTKPFPTDPKKIDAKAFEKKPTMQGFMVSPDGKWTLLGSAGGKSSVGIAIGPGGTIAGITETATGDSHAFSMAPRGPMQDLGTLGGTDSNAFGVNARGDVVGVSSLSGTDDGHAFLYSNGAFKDLGTLGGDKSDARSINDSGVIVGGSTVKDGSTHPFVYRDGTMTDLLPNDREGKPYASASAEHIANNGKIVGWGVLNHWVPDGSMRCLMWTPSR